MAMPRPAIALLWCGSPRRRASAPAVALLPPGLPPAIVTPLVRAGPEPAFAFH